MPPQIPDNQRESLSAADEGDDVASSRRYSMAEAAEALGCHIMTLRRWLRVADRDIEPEPDERDRRFKWLTQAQVTQLGRRHRQGRLSEPSQDHTAARLADLERRIEELEAALAALRGPPLPPARPQVRSDTEEGEAPWQPPRPHRGPSTHPLGPTTTLDLLPEGWVPWSRWAQDHGVPIRTMQTKVHGDPKRGIAPVLAFHRGPWRSRHPRPVPVTEAFDPDQQEAARVYFGR